ncbi:hypothetical protein T265_01261 [Opisthorchis viverrini]|uniref:Uncharacterized protein n=1 Tax=Opisthorchis viverrini TaxID=6198 RepID=A0A075A0B1_OPIVI|nr:hypothetical protein T265_01261 [Opisthorchis viverrini]KER32781.1 hypothetical protein T265_01261 [Opisthorchis viverrini]
MDSDHAFLCCWFSLRLSCLRKTHTSRLATKNFVDLEIKQDRERESVDGSMLRKALRNRTWRSECAFTSVVSYRHNKG